MTQGEAPTTWFQQTGRALQAWWEQGTNLKAPRQRYEAGVGGIRPSVANDLVGVDDFLSDGYESTWPNLMKTTAANARRMLYGTYGPTLCFTESDSHLLILGPPRVNKTAGVLVPLILSAAGPVVSSSARDDVLRACATTRSRMGRIWHFTPDGSPTAPGATPLRWSPLTPDYSKARRFAKAMLETAEAAQSDGGGRNGAYFADQAARLVAPVLVAAALEGHSMEWVVEILLAQDPDFFIPVQEILATHPEVPGTKNASVALNGILNMPGSHGSAADIFATAARAFEVYNDPGVLAATEPPNFDPASFVAGQPTLTNPDRFARLDEQLANAPVQSIQDRLPRGVYDTIFITAEADAAAAVAPVIVGLLSALHRAAAAQTQADQAAGVYDRPPMTWALDEVASMAPWPKFPQVLSTSAGSNVLVAAVFHDLAQAKAKWQVEAAGLRTLMKDKLIFPGIDNPETLREISEAIGGHFVTLQSDTDQYGTSVNGGLLTGTGGKQSSRSTTTSQQWMPILDPGTISRGHPEDPTAVLATSSRLPEGHMWMHPMPYYSAPPWAEVMVGSLMHLGNTASPDDPRTRLPVPILDRDDGAALSQMRAPEEARRLVDNLRSYRQWQGQLPPITADVAPPITPEAPSTGPAADELYGPVEPEGFQP